MSSSAPKAHPSGAEGAPCQRPRDGDPLLHAAGQLIVGSSVAKPSRPTSSMSLRSSAGSRWPPVPRAPSASDVVPHRFPGQQVYVWKRRQAPSTGARGPDCRPDGISPAEQEMRPAINRAVVDLPQPDGPSRETKAPADTSSETSWSACSRAPRTGKAWLRLRTETCASAGAEGTSEDMRWPQFCSPLTPMVSGSLPGVGPSAGQAAGIRSKSPALRTIDLAASLARHTRARNGSGSVSSRPRANIISIGYHSRKSHRPAPNRRRRGCGRVG